MQPFPKLALHPTDIRPLRLWDFTDPHRTACERLFAGIRYEGIFTPPSTNGTLVYPSNAGGTNWGYITNGGPLVTGGGVVILATTSDRMLRAYRGADGREVWSTQLPASAHATPMSYRHDGADYVVVAVGGGRADGQGRGDHLVAFRLAHDVP